MQSKAKKLRHLLQNKKDKHCTSCRDGFYEVVKELTDNAHIRTSPCTEA